MALRDKLEYLCWLILPHLHLLAGVGDVPAEGTSSEPGVSATSTASLEKNRAVSAEAEASVEKTHNFPTGAKFGQ